MTIKNTCFHQEVQYIIVIKDISDFLFTQKEYLFEEIQNKSKMFSSDSIYISDEVFFHLNHYLNISTTPNKNITDDPQTLSDLLNKYIYQNVPMNSCSLKIKIIIQEAELITSISLLESVFESLISRLKLLNSKFNINLDICVNSLNTINFINRTLLEDFNISRGIIVFAKMTDVSTNVCSLLNDNAVFFKSSFWLSAVPRSRNL